MSYSFTGRTLGTFFALQKSASGLPREIAATRPRSRAEVYHRPREDATRLGPERAQRFDERPMCPARDG